MTFEELNAWRQKLNRAQDARMEDLLMKGATILAEKKAIVGTVTFEDGTTAPLKRIKKGST